MEKRKTAIVNPKDLIPPKGHVLNADVVDSIAESISKVGLLQPIAIVGRHIKYGVHRWAAVMKLGYEEIEVIRDRKVETDDEHDAQVIVENLCRHHYKGQKLDDMRKRLVDLWEPQIAQEMKISQKDTNIAKPQDDTGDGQKRSPGRKKTARGKAIKQVAKQTGTTEGAVKESVRRAKAAEAGVTPKQPDDPPPLDEPEVTVDDYGTEIPEGEVGRWNEARQLLDELDSIMRGVQIKLGELVKIKGMPYSVVSDLDKRAQQFAELAQKYHPVALCLECSGTGKNPNNTNGCTHCVGVGFIAEVNYKAQTKPATVEEEPTFTEDDLDW
jgi:hypothetical protein